MIPRYIYVWPVFPVFEVVNMLSIPYLVHATCMRRRGLDLIYSFCASLCRTDACPCLWFWGKKVAPMEDHWMEIKC